MTFFPVVFLKNCGPELSYILDELVSICVWGNFVFHIVWTSYLWSWYMRILRKGLPRKTTALLVVFLWLVNSLKNMLITDFFITSRSVVFFLISNVGFRFLTVKSDRILRAFNRFAVTRTVAFDISKALNWDFHANLLRKLKSHEISNCYLDILNELHRQDEASFSLFYKYYCSRCTSERAEMVSFPHSYDKYTCYYNRKSLVG